MDDYRRLVLSGNADATSRRSDRLEAGSGSRTDERRMAAERRASLAPLRKRLEGLETRMSKLSDAISKVDAALADGSAFQKDPAKASDLARKRAEAAEALASTEEEWLALSGEIEAAGV
jgi:ATP-binding cassette subfamily F protein 3